MSNDVLDDRDAGRFVVTVDGEEAELLYRERAKRLILIHTEVPDELAGHGIGGQLVRAAIIRAKREQLTIVPWCPFARQWLADHPSEAEQISIDWDTLPPN